eukprot:2361530-Prorocentrum_lima.AAC.1
MLGVAHLREDPHDADGNGLETAAAVVIDVALAQQLLFLLLTGCAAQESRRGGALGSCVSRAPSVLHAQATCSRRRRGRR